MRKNSNMIPLDLYLKVAEHLVQGGGGGTPLVDGIGGGPIEKNKIQYYVVYYQI